MTDKAANPFSMYMQHKVAHHETLRKIHLAAHDEGHGDHHRALAAEHARMRDLAKEFLEPAGYNAPGVPDMEEPEQNVPSFGSDTFREKFTGDFLTKFLG